MEREWPTNGQRINTRSTSEAFFVMIVHLVKSALRAVLSALWPSACSGASGPGIGPLERGRDERTGSGIGSTTVSEWPERIPRELAPAPPPFSKNRATEVTRNLILKDQGHLVPHSSRLKQSIQSPISWSSGACLASATISSPATGTRRRAEMGATTSSPPVVDWGRWGGLDQGTVKQDLSLGAP